MTSTVIMYWIKVSHALAFKTSSVRSVYIKIIVYAGSILANLNNTMQTKQHAMKKPQSYSIYNFEVEGSLVENVQNLHFLMI